MLLPPYRGRSQGSLGLQVHSGWFQFDLCSSVPFQEVEVAEKYVETQAFSKLSLISKLVSYNKPVFIAANSFANNIDFTRLQ